MPSTILLGFIRRGLPTLGVQVRPRAFAPRGKACLQFIEFLAEPRIAPRGKTRLNDGSNFLRAL